MLPKQLKYDNKINASYARNFNSSIAPQNTSNFTLGETCIINIPTSPNMFLSGADSVLSFNLSITNATGGAASAATAFGKAGVAGCIRRLRIFHGSTLLQDTDNYGQLCAMLYAGQRSREDLAGKGFMLELTGDGNKGAVIGAIANNGVYSAHVCIPLVSILSMSDNYTPLWAMTGAPLRLEIQWENSIAKFLGASVAFTPSAGGCFRGVKFIANMIEVSDQGMAIIQQSLEGKPVEWVTQAYSNFQSSNALANAVVTQLSIPVPAKYHSLKGLFATFREYASGAASHFADDSPNFNLTSYTTRIGAQTVPSDAPNTIPEYLCELERALGCVSNRHDVSSYSAAQYSAATSGGITVSGAFAVGVELESYSNLSDMSSTYSGMNTSTSDIFFNPTFGGGGGAVQLMTDVFALYDQLIVIQDGMTQVQV
jgi:hypothetical protein